MGLGAELAQPLAEMGVGGAADGGGAVAVNQQAVDVLDGGLVGAVV